MTLWELAVCVEGINYSNNPEGKMEPPTDEEFAAMLESYDHMNATKQ